VEPDTYEGRAFCRPAYCLGCGDSWQEEGYVGFRAYQSCPACVGGLSALFWYLRYWLFRAFGR